jgi:transglutaminase-like putative cysteine protease
LVLQHFDGVIWTQFGPDLDADASKTKIRAKEKAIKSRILQKGEALNYEVIYQKSGQPWMFSLTPVVDIKGEAFYGSDFRIMARKDIIEPKLLTLKSYPDSLRDIELDESMRETALQLPAGGNQKSRLLATQLLSESASEEEYIQKVLNRYREQQYFYTLRPPKLGTNDTIDAFLIESKKGFCAHYSGSFVFMMRAAGIPARVVSGYQGGEWNKAGKFLAVHQFDAHAWTEVWLKGKGWIRVDPTAMVAPQRIEQNLEAAMQEEGSFLEGKILSLNKVKWLNSLRIYLDSAQYSWRRFVLGYDSGTQQNFLKGLFGELSIQKTMLIVGGFFVGIILLWVAFLGLAKKRTNEAMEHQLYRRFCELLEKKGIKRERSQTPESFGNTAILHLPDFAEQINAFTQSYSALCYNPASMNAKQNHLDKMKLLLKGLK